MALHDGIEDTVLRFEQLSEVLFAGAIVLIFLLARGPDAARPRRAAVAALASAALAVLVAGLIAAIVDRSRPFVADPSAVHLFAAHAADSGFPSDHATAAFAIACAVMLRDRALGLPLLVLAALVSAGRVALGLHYPSDVLAGALLGALAAAVCFLPPIRRATDAVADLTGEQLDRLLGRGGRRAHVA